MSNWNASGVPTRDPGYGMHPSRSQHWSQVSATQRLSEPQQTSDNNMIGSQTMQSSIDPSNLYRQNVSPGFSSQLQSQPQAWYQASQNELMRANAEYKSSVQSFGNSAPRSDISIESYSGDHTGQYQDQLHGGQHMSSVRHTNRSHPSQEPFMPERSLLSPLANSRASESRTYASGPTSSTTNTSIRPMLSGDSIAVAAKLAQSQQGLRESSFKKIGDVYSNDETKEFRFECHVEGCTGAPCGRTQELKRHYDTFHKDLKIWCPVKNCERSKGVGMKGFPEARKDKLRDHVRNMHVFELEI